MPRATLSFGEFRPDLALLDNQFAGVADNVFPGLNSYQPMPGLAPLSPGFAALPSACLGLFTARKQDGSWKIYAGTKTDLYIWSSTSGWVSATRTVGGSYSVITTWSFAQFGTNLVACSGTNDVLQVIDIEAGLNFAALGGSPPKCNSVTVIGDFLVAVGILNSPLQIQWSAINNITGWTIGVNLSDNQIFPEGGLVQAVSGSESIGYVVQDRCIRTMQFLPGDTTFIFSFTRVVKERGCISPLGATTVADVLYFIAEDGFYALANTQLVPIGQDKINQWFLANSDAGTRNATQALIHSRPYVIWAFHGFGSTLNYNRLLVYNWANQRWSTGTVQAQFWATAASLPLDLDTTGGETNDVWADAGGGLPGDQAPPAPQSLDSAFYIGGRPFLAAVDTNGQLGSLTGNNLSATLETAEAHLVPGQRAFVSDAYPLVDSANVLVTPATRERLGDPIVYGAAVPIEVTGSSSVLASARLWRFRCTTPPADLWTNAQGVQVDAQPDGFA